MPSQALFSLEGTLGEGTMERTRRRPRWRPAPYRGTANRRRVAKGGERRAPPPMGIYGDLRWHGTWNGGRGPFAAKCWRQVGRLTLVSVVGDEVVPLGRSTGVSALWMVGAVVALGGGWRGGAQRATSIHSHPRHTRPTCPQMRPGGPEGGPHLPHRQPGQHRQEGSKVAGDHLRVLAEVIVASHLHRALKA